MDFMIPYTYRGYTDRLLKEVHNMGIIIMEEKCPQNHSCPATKVCPVDALLQIHHEAPKVDMDKCIECNKCVKACPMGAIVSGNL